MTTYVKYLSVFISLQFFFLVSLNAQFVSMNYGMHHIYNVVRNDKVIGSFTVNTIASGNQFTIRTESDFTIQVIMSFQAKATTLTTFYGGILTQLSVVRTLNGKVKLQNELQLVEGKYKVIKGEIATLPAKAILYCVSSLYISEPVNITDVFSEVYLSFLKIKKMADGVYETALPDGGVMTYTYQLGTLVLVNANTAYATIQYQLKK